MSAKTHRISEIENNEIINNSFECNKNDIYKSISDSKKYFIDLCNKDTLFYDKIDIVKYDAILRNYKTFEPQLIKEVEEMRMNNKNHSYNLETILNNIKNNVIIPPHLNNSCYGYIRTSYKKSNGSNNRGRAYVKGGIGIQQLITSLRGCICNDIYVDIDIVNAHPTILNQLFIKKSLNCPLLNQYVNNRQEILKKICDEEKCNEDKAKNIVISIIYGSNKYKSKYLKAFYNEIYNNTNELLVDEEYKEIIEQVKAKTNRNIEGKVISLIIQEIENRCLESYIEYSNYKGLIPKINKRYVVSGIFDGFQILKNDDLNDDILREIENYAEYITGYKTKLKIKPFNQSLLLPEDYENDFKKLRYSYLIDEIEEIEPEENKEENKELNKEEGNIIIGADDDEGAADLVVRHYKERLIICNAELYVSNGRIWTGNEKEVNKYLCNMIKSLNIKFYGADGKRTYKYSSSTKHQQNAIKAIKNNLDIKVDNRFIENLSLKNKYYLPFINGVFSFKEKRLIKWDELQDDIYFMFIIERELKENNDNDYKELLERVINPIYPNEKISIFNAQIKARAIAGCVQDKRYYQQIGARNSGKGVETDILKYAFGDYVGLFDTSCLLYNKNRVYDAKNLSWLYNKKHCRILIGNEADKIDDDLKPKEKPILNGKLIKQLASGGDKIELRQNYKNEEDFKIGFTLFINSNDLLDITTKDAKENLVIMEYASKFVEKDKLIEGFDFYKLKDDKIKDLITEDRIINAYIWYILNNYLDEVPKEPEEIKQSTETNNEAEKEPVEIFIFKNFEKTADANDKYHIEELKEILNCAGYDVGKNITTLFSRVKIGEYNKNITINKIKKAGFYNLKYKGEL